jgi:hypothetical protein
MRVLLRRFVPRVPEAGGVSYRSRYNAFFAAACAGPSRGSMLIIRMSKSLPASSDNTPIVLVIAFTTWVQSIGQS